MNDFDVVGLGIATLDILAQTPRLPASNDCFPIPRLDMQGGGPVATALVALSRLGARCAYLGALAQDETAAQIVAELEQYGVDTSRSPRRAQGLSSASVILVEQQTGDRSILFQKSTVNDLTPDEVPEGLLKNARALHLDGFFTPAAIRAAQLARRHGVLVSFDGGAGDVMWDDIHQLLPLVDVLVAARRFAAEITGHVDPLQAGPLLLEKFANREIVITDGQRGCWYWDASTHLHQPAFAVDVVDTTGAGDVFHGAYLFACLQPGWEPDFRLKFASATAALKCAHLGGRKGIPSLEQVMGFLAKRGEIREIGYWGGAKPPQ
jgi:sulfofructose kinase